MTLARCLLVALALWMPMTSFAAAVTARDYATACAEPSTPEDADDAQAEEDLHFLAPSVNLFLAPARKRILDADGQHPLIGHVVELLIPPPNPSSSR